MILKEIASFPFAPKLIRVKSRLIDGALKLIRAKSRAKWGAPKLVRAKINTNKVVEFFYIKNDKLVN